MCGDVVVFGSLIMGMLSVRGGCGCDGVVVMLRPRYVEGSGMFVWCL